MWRRFCCWCGWHRWVEVWVWHRVCADCGKRQVLQFYSNRTSEWLDDNE